jgi:hypothetical protein
MRYAAGSVAGRWVAVPEGAAYIVVRAMLLDANSHSLVGDMLAVQEISAGGLFSIGAENTIVIDAAHDITKALVQQTTSSH